MRVVWSGFERYKGIFKKFGEKGLDLESFTGKEFNTGFRKHLIINRYQKTHLSKENVFTRGYFIDNAEVYLRLPQHLIWSSLRHQLTGFSC